MSPVPRSSALRCYLCGEVASGADEHVPPEVLFRGAIGSYKRPVVLRVPACVAHNEDTSGDDELFAWVMSSFPSPSVGLDVHQALMQTVTARALSDPAFADERLDHIGVRVLRAPADYDASGLPHSPALDADYIRATEAAVRARWTRIERTIRKVSAGLFFHASGRRRVLGLEETARLRVLAPQFKEVTAERISLVGSAISEDAFFGAIATQQRLREWQPISSGAPDVFEGSILMPIGDGRRFSLRMRFYRYVSIWVTSPHD